MIHLPKNLDGALETVGINLGYSSLNLFIHLKKDTLENVLHIVTETSINHSKNVEMDYLHVFKIWQIILSQSANKQMMFRFAFASTSIEITMNWTDS